MTRTLGRSADHRTHLMRNLGRSLVLTERVTTTLPKAKSLRPLVEVWITKAKKAAMARDAERLARHRELLQIVHHTDVVRKLIDDLALRTKDRAGGYTRIRKLGTRVGDAAPMARIELVDQPLPAPSSKAEKAEPKPSSLSASKGQGKATVKKPTVKKKVAK